MDELLEILPEAASASWRHDPEAYRFLSEVTGYGAEELAHGPKRLAESKKQLIQETEDLAFKNYKAFIHTATCSRDIFKDFTSIEKHVGVLEEELPSLSATCKTFHTRAQELAKVRSATMTTLAHHTQLLELLEIPQLMEMCVKSRYFDEALQLRSHVARLVKRHDDIPIIHGIAAEVELYARQMLSGLVAQLKTDVQLTECLKVVSHLRSLHAFSEVELRILFLQARDAWLSKELHIPPSDAHQYITKVIEANRVHLFSIITQYKAIFASGTEVSVSSGGIGGGSGGGSGGAGGAVSHNSILYDWAMRKVAQFLSVLDKALPRVTDRLNLILGQCMHFAMSLGRHGLDFRALLSPIFERAVTHHFTTRLEAATQTFKKDVVSNPLSAHTVIGSQTGLDTPASAPVPLSLMSHTSLGMLTNSYLTAFNQLRECAPLGIAFDLARVLGDNMRDVGAFLASHHREAMHTFDQRELGVYQGLCAMFTSTFAPAMLKCFEAIYPAAAFQIPGVSSNESKGPASQIALLVIVSPLEGICPDAVQKVRAHEAKVALPRKDIVLTSAVTPATQSSQEAEPLRDIAPEAAPAPPADANADVTAADATADAPPADATADATAADATADATAEPSIEPPAEPPTSEPLPETAADAPDAQSAPEAVERDLALDEMLAGLDGEQGEEGDDSDMSSADAEALYWRWVEEMRQVMGEDKLRVLDLFHAFDTNGDGVISRAEFSAGIQQVQLKTRLTPREVRALVGHIDKDGNDRIDYREFAQNMRARRPSAATAATSS